MNTTPNYDLILVPEVTDLTIREWRAIVSGDGNSNMAKIDTALSTLADEIGSTIIHRVHLENSNLNVWEYTTGYYLFDYVGGTINIRGKRNDTTYTAMGAHESPLFCYILAESSPERYTLYDIASGMRYVCTKDTSSGYICSTETVIESPTGGKAGQVLALGEDGKATWKTLASGDGGSTGLIDGEMSNISENAVQNKVIKKYIDDLIGDFQAVASQIDAVIGGTA